MFFDHREFFPVQAHFEAGWVDVGVVEATDRRIECIELGTAASACVSQRWQSGSEFAVAEKRLEEVLMRRPGGHARLAEQFDRVDDFAGFRTPGAGVVNGISKESTVVVEAADLLQAGSGNLDDLFAQLDPRLPRSPTWCRRPRH